MTPRRSSVLLAALVLVTATAPVATAERASHVRSSAASDQLAIMVLRPSELGPPARGLQLSESSGPKANEEYEAPGPRTCRTPAELGRLGRTTGYDLSYEDYDLSNLKAGRGPVEVGTSVERFRDDAAASAGLARSLEDVTRNIGVASGDARIVTVERLPVTIPDADESLAWRDVSRLGRYSIHRVVIAVRVGSLVGTAAGAWADSGPHDDEVIALATRLRARIAGVLAGQIGGSPVEIPTDAISAPKVRPRLTQLALTPADVGPGSWVASGEYVSTSAVASFERAISPGCRSPLLLVGSDVTLARDVASATAGYRALASGLPGFGRRLERFGPGRAIGLFANTTTAPLAIGPVGDARTSIRVRYKGPLGNGEYAFAVIRVERSVLFLLVVGRPGKPIARATVDRLARRAVVRAQAGLRAAR